MFDEGLDKTRIFIEITLNPEEFAYVRVVLGFEDAQRRGFLVTFLTCSKKVTK